MQETPLVSTALAIWAFLAFLTLFVWAVLISSGADKSLGLISSWDFLSKYPHGSLGFLVGSMLLKLSIGFFFVGLF